MITALYLANELVFRRASSVSSSDEGYVTGKAVYDYVSGLSGWSGGTVSGTADFRAQVDFSPNTRIKDATGRIIMSTEQKIEPNNSGFPAYRYVYRTELNTSIDFEIQSDVITGNDDPGGGGGFLTSGGMRMIPQSFMHQASGYSPAWLDDKYNIVNVAMLKAKLDTLPKPSSRCGMIVAFIGNATPEGSLYMNGQEYYDSSYPDLARLLKSMNSEFNGSASGKFKLPDYRGVFLRGWDDGRGYDPGRAAYSGQMDDIRHHTHYLNYNIAHIDNNNGEMKGMQSGGYWGDQRITMRTITAGGTGGNETRPINRSVKYAIYY